MDGRGRFFWPDGREFYGTWKEGKQEGPGTFSSKTGEKRTGVWKDGGRVKWIDSSEAYELHQDSNSMIA